MNNNEQIFFNLLLKSLNINRFQKKTLKNINLWYKNNVTDWEYNFEGYPEIELINTFKYFKMHKKILYDRISEFIDKYDKDFEKLKIKKE